MKIFSRSLLVLAAISAAPLSATVFVTNPSNGSIVGSNVQFVAKADTTCGQGVASMGIYVDDNLKFIVSGSSLNTSLQLGSGAQRSVVQAWDFCGGATSTPINVTVNSQGSQGTTLSNLQASGGWNQWGELPPVYDICNGGSCSGVEWSMNQHISAGSLSGNSTQFNIGGWRPYSDVLWSNPVIGQGSTQNLPDYNHSLLPTVHHLTYDTFVYVTNLAVTQDLEFDVNMYMYGLGMEWGTECNHLNGGAWDIWNNVAAKWVPTNIPCNLNNNAWNHVVLQVERLSNNDLLYKTLTVNDVTYSINQTVAPFQVPSGWWGMTVNYQMDGNYRQASNTTYLDKLSVTYW